MSAATDRIKRSAALAVINAFADELGWTDEQRSIAQRSISGHRIGNYKYLTSRGTLLGYPLSFTILCALHLWCTREIECKAAAIFGDDALLRVSSEEYSAYLDNCRAVGFVINIAKTHESSYGGTFCGQYFFSSDVTTLNRYRIPFLSSILGSGEEREERTSTGFRVPSWKKWIQILTTELKECADRRERAMVYNEITKRRISMVIAIWRKRGLDPHMPEFLGGMGLPTARKVKVPKESALLFQRYLMLSHREGGMDELSRHIQSVLRQTKYAAMAPCMRETAPHVAHLMSELKVLPLRTPKSSQSVRFAPLPKPGDGHIKKERTEDGVPLSDALSDIITACGTTIARSIYEKRGGPKVHGWITSIKTAATIISKLNKNRFPLSIPAKLPQSPLSYSDMNRDQLMISRADYQTLCGMLASTHIAWDLKDGSVYTKGLPSKVGRQCERKVALLKQSLLDLVTESTSDIITSNDINTGPTQRISWW